MPASKKPIFALAQHRQGYAAWCNRNGVKQNHAVFLRDPGRIAGMSLEPEQILIIDGWQKNPRGLELRGAIAVAERRVQA